MWRKLCMPWRDIKWINMDVGTVPHPFRWVTTASLAPVQSLLCFSTISYLLQVSGKTNSRGLAWSHESRAGFVCQSIAKAPENLPMTGTGCRIHVCSVLSAVFISRQSSILIWWKASSCAIKLLTSTSARDSLRWTPDVYMRRSILMSTLPSCRFLIGCKNCWKENGRFLCQMEICWDWIFWGWAHRVGAYVGCALCGSLSQKNQNTSDQQPLRSSF